MPPTEVTKGHAAGKIGRKRVVFFPSFVWQALPVPVSPLEKRTETPRAPSWAKRLQVLRNYQHRQIIEGQSQNSRIGIGCWHTLLVLTIGGGQRFGKLAIWQPDDIVKEVEVRLILIACWVWLIKIGDELTESAGAVVSARREVRKRQGVLDIHYLRSASGGDLNNKM